MAGGEGGPSFDSTPSWIIGVVVLIIVSISLVVEKLLHHLGQILTRKNKKPLYDALLKIKEELMLMGFVSLLLAVFQGSVQKKCIREDVARHWLPCHSVVHEDNPTSNTATAHFTIFSKTGRKLLAEAASDFSCPAGKVPFISLDVLHRIHYLIFILAVVHVVTCTLTVVLGKVKINQWRKWEESIRIKNHFDDGNGNNDRVIDLHSLTFFKDRFEGVDADKRNYVISFFKHLCGIVTKADYETMRMGFILTHFNGDYRFHFHKYLVYAYEADFKKVVSISWFLWLLAVMSLSFNVAGWHIYTWISIVPLLLLLIVGTKLEQVITDLAIYVAQRHTVIVGQVKIQPSDDYFWFKKPSLVLQTIHIVLFLNSFGIAIFIWTWTQFGFHSCIMGQAEYVYPRIVIMVLVQTICSYSTLPLYAIVTQMGSSYNKAAMERYGSSHNTPVGVASNTS